MRGSTKMAFTNGNNVVWHHAAITRSSRAAQNDHGSLVLWFTGLSGSGKSTIAHAVEERLHDLGCRTYVLDGDNVRHGLNADLGFSDADRQENIRRIGEVAKLFVDAGVITLTAFISPFRDDRRRVRTLMGEGDLVEIYCKCPLAVCESRDPKGLYRRARAGEIKGYTGISSPYEEPEAPELTIDTSAQGVAECVTAIEALLRARGTIR